MFSCTCRPQAALWFQPRVTEPLPRLSSSTTPARSVPVHSASLLRAIVGSPHRAVLSNVTARLLLQASLKMRVRLSYCSQGAVCQETVQIDSFPTPVANWPPPASWDTDVVSTFLVKGVCVENSWIIWWSTVLYYAFFIALNGVMNTSDYILQTVQCSLSVRLSLIVNYKTCFTVISLNPGTIVFHRLNCCCYVTHMLHFRQD